MSELKVNSVLDANGGNTATINGFAPSVSNMAGRNRIINGAMNISQRGSAFLPLPVNSYFIDRWAYVATTTAVINAAQNTDVPSSQEFRVSLRTEVTTADTSIAAGDVAVVSQRVEGYNVRDLIGRTFTLSFWVRSSKTGVHCAFFKNSGNDRSYVAEYTVNSANTWEFKTITVTGGLITAGTWNWVEGIGLQVGWTLAAGSTFQTTSNAWQTGNFLATSSQVNCLDTIGNIFAVTGVQLEAGSVATPFEYRPYGQELALCQRYYIQYDENDQFRAAATATGTTSMEGLVSLPVQMRAIPTVTTSASIYNIVRGITNADRTISGTGGTTSKLISITCAAPSSTSGTDTGIIYTDTAQFVKCTAEL